MEKFERTTGKKREKYLRKEVPELRDSIEIILNQLRDRIDDGTYYLVIGDDASGRVPALVFDRLLKAIYKEKGYPAPETKFVAGSGSSYLHVEGEEAEKKYGLVEEWAGKIPVPGVEGSPVPSGKRVLVVTEAIVTGKSLTPLMNALTNKGIPFDIAVLGVRESDLPELQEGIQKNYGAEIISGGKNIYPKIMHQEEVSGVYKDIEELHSRPKRGDVAANRSFLKSTKRRLGDLQKTINETRHDVDLLAQKLLEWYKEGEKDKEKEKAA